MARSRHPHHRPPLQPGRGVADRQGVPAEMAQRGPASVCDAGSPTAACRPRSSAMPKHGWRRPSGNRMPSPRSLPRPASLSARSSGGSRRQPGATLIDHVQNLRVEEAKRLLETERLASPDEIAAAVGYENPAFFRRLFKRCTGLTPGQYRHRFVPSLAWGASLAPNQRLEAHCKLQPGVSPPWVRS